MARRWRRFVSASVIAVLVLGGAGSAVAYVDPYAIARIALLAQIALTAVDIYKTVKSTNGASKALRDRMEEMFPDETRREIQSFFAQVRSVEDEMRALSCRWRFSVRVEGLRKGLLRQGPLCKKEYQAVFGEPLPGLDQDLKEYQQWQGVLRMNMVKETIEQNAKWTTAGDWLGREARAGGHANDPNNPASVGWSMRLLAEAEAFQLQVAARDNSLEAVRLAGLQEDLDGARREEWQRGNSQLQRLEQGSRQARLGPSPGARSVDGLR